MGSALLRENEGSGDDDKIYWFFTERSQEQTPSYTASRVARVARICRVRLILAANLRFRFEQNVTRF